MKSFLCFLICLLSLSVFSVHADDLLKSRQRSYDTHIYKISDKEAEKINKKGEQAINETFLHTLVDTYPTDSIYKEQLPPGHYIKTFVEKNTQKYLYTYVPDFNVFILDNDVDLRIQVYDFEGNVIKDAEVKAGSRKLKYDAELQCYVQHKSNKKGLLTVKSNNNTAFYTIKRMHNNPAILRGARKVLYSVPLRYVWRPVNFIIHIPIDGVKSIVKNYPIGSIRKISSFPGKLFQNSYEFNKKHRGYMVFNKPKYLPGDTVKFKAYVVKKDKKPIKKQVDVMLTESYTNNKSIQITSLKPYTKGAYEYQFLLHDSLQLQLDKNYFVSLNKNKKKRYIQSSFKYEDYELSKASLNVRIDTDKQFKNQSFYIYAQGKDENNLTLPDARVEIVARSRAVQKTSTDHLFLPDTLFYMEKQLDAKGETKILIPDSVFPAANFLYELEISMFTSDNEYDVSNKLVHFSYHQKNFEIDLQADSLLFTYNENGIKKSQEVIIYGVDNFGITTPILTSQTPCKLPVNPVYKKYVAENADALQSVDISGLPPLLQCNAWRTNDSVFIDIQNPRNLTFSYNIYKKDKEIARGTDNTLHFSETATRQNYFISLQYVWGGEVLNVYRRIALQDKKLNISVEQPQLVHPGQTTNVNIQVTDFKGNPVQGVDLTAYGITKKFESSTPIVPYLGKSKKNRSRNNRFSLSDTKTLSTDLFYNYKNTVKLFGLDSVEYFKFIHPGKNIYRYEYTPENKVTQLAPYVFTNNGHTVPVQVIYVDNKPVFISLSSTTERNPYSFEVTPGYHQIKLRTVYKTIVLDKVYIPDGKKLILSLNENITGENIHTEKTKPELTKHEKDVLYKYMFKYKTDFTNQFAYIQTDQNILLLNTPNRYYDTWVGPVNGNIKFQYNEEYSLNFIHKPFYQYEFTPQLLKMEKIDKEAYPSYFHWYNNRGISLSDEHLTTNDVTKKWDEYVNNKRRYNYSYNYRYNYTYSMISFGTLLLNVKPEQNKPLNLLVLKHGDPSFIRLCGEIPKTVDNLPEGTYKLICFFPNKNYYVLDSVQIKPHGRTWVSLDFPEVMLKDNQELSQIDNLISEYYLATYDQKDEKLEKIMLLHKKNMKNADDLLTISGIVNDYETKKPLMNAIVNVPGTKILTITNSKGEYLLFVPKGKDSLCVTQPGYHSRLVNINRARINIDLQKNEAYTGYSYQGYMSGAPEILLQGKVSGMRVRGAASVPDNSPMYVIDGAVYTGDISILDPLQVGSIEILKDASASGIYGSRAASGVIVISTINGNYMDMLALNENDETDLNTDEFMEADLNSSSIRSNFSDYAYWQPRLTTDKNGKTSFEVTYPDDVTNWQVSVLAMNGKRQSGQLTTNVKSFKPLMAQLSVPNFLLQPDTAHIIGKVLNYKKDSVEVNTVFTLNGDTLHTDTAFCTNVIVDTLQITALTDTVTACYAMRKADGYFDGEEREIPVFQLGMEEAKGDFLILDADTAFYKQYDSTLGKVHVYAKSDYIEVCSDEITRLVNYRYLCNEQQASRLKALLAEKTIAEYQGRKWNNDNKIEKLIQHLLKSRNSNYLWGWWQHSETSYNFSFHIIDALLQAKEKGFAVNLDVSSIAEILVYELGKDKNNVRNIDILHILKRIDSPVDYGAYLKALETNTDFTFNEQLKLMELKQLCGMDIDIKKLLLFKQETLLGNLYFSNGNENTWPYHIENNVIQNTVLAYRILKRENKAETNQLLSGMRRYFMEKKSVTGWHNTYETAKIIETILPDILTDKQTAKQPSMLTISGDVNTTVTTFPFETDFDPQKGISISKTGTDPVYLTMYQHEWNKNPEKKQDNFIIETYFENQNNVLPAGKPIQLMVKLTVLKDADYVMINVPIPAGCSYTNKKQYYGIEIHREYFKNETTIFCQKLPAGEYTFNIELISKFAGNYTMNPAKVELMYFPTLNGNNMIKKIKIQ